MKKKLAGFVKKAGGFVLIILGLGVYWLLLGNKHIELEWWRLCALSLAGLLLVGRKWFLGIILIPVGVWISAIGYEVSLLPSLDPLTLVFHTLSGFVAILPAIGVSLLFRKKYRPAIIFLIIALLLLLLGLFLRSNLVVGQSLGVIAIIFWFILPAEYLALQLSILVLSVGMVFVGDFRDKLPHSDEKNIMFEQKKKVKSKNGNPQELKTLEQEGHASANIQAVWQQEERLKGLLLLHYVGLERNTSESIQEAVSVIEEIAKIDPFTSLLVAGDMSYESALYKLKNSSGNPTEDAKKVLRFYQQAEELKRVCAWLWAKYAKFFMLAKTEESWRIVEICMRNATDVNSEDPEVQETNLEYQWRKTNQQTIVAETWDSSFVKSFIDFQKKMKNKKNK